MHALPGRETSRLIATSVTFECSFRNRFDPKSPHSIQLLNRCRHHFQPSR